MLNLRRKWQPGKYHNRRSYWGLCYCCCSWLWNYCNNSTEVSIVLHSHVDHVWQSMFVFCFHRRRISNRIKHDSYKPNLCVDTTLNHASSEHFLSIVSIINNIITEPAIVEFPGGTHVVEGERVELQVRVAGSPETKLMWYHDGEEVVADYSTELAENVTLTLPSAEARHRGVYQLVAENTAGRVEREVELDVIVEEEEKTQDGQVMPPPPKIEFGAVPVAMFGEHVEKNHASVNKGFNEEFQVYAAQL